MRPRQLRRRLILAGLGGMLAAATITTATAKADDVTFLQALNDRGLVTYDTSRTLLWGHAICEALNHTTGDVVAGNFYRITNWDVPDIYTAYVWVEVSVEQLCPEQDHRGLRA